MSKGDAQHLIDMLKWIKKKIKKKQQTGLI